MRNLFKYLKKVRRDLLLLLGVALTTHLLIEVVFNNYAGLFKGAHALGQFFSRISLAYVTSFIFYFVVVHLKSERDKENINEYVGKKVYDILTSARLLIQPLLQKNNSKATFRYMQKKELTELLRSIKRDEKEAPLIIGEQNATWVQWYEYLKKSTEDSISEIFARYNHLDTKLIKRLTRIHRSLFFLSIQPSV
jgi:hypothetical protein